jgi:D-tyrosyl-tRNA(Tyr) deacylase
VRIVLQRVARASVRVGGEEVASIGRGYLLLVGVGHGDGPEQAERLADKVVNLRIFRDDQGKTNLSLGDVGGAALVVSQFTLYADTRRGRRPSFVDAAEPDEAAAHVESFAQALEAKGVAVGRGVFGAEMAVDLVNDGPFTLTLEA